MSYPNLFSKDTFFAYYIYSAVYLLRINPDLFWRQSGLDEWWAHACAGYSVWNIRITCQHIGFDTVPRKPRSFIRKVAEYLRCCWIGAGSNIWHILCHVARGQSTDFAGLESTYVTTSGGVAVTHAAKNRHGFTRMNQINWYLSLTGPMQLEFSRVTAILMINDDICCSASTWFRTVYPNPEIVPSIGFVFIVFTARLNMHL